MLAQAVLLNEKTTKNKPKIAQQINANNISFPPILTDTRAVCVCIVLPHMNSFYSLYLSRVKKIVTTGRRIGNICGEFSP